MTVPITRFDHTSFERRKLARRCSNGYQTSRILAIADILDGKNRTQSAERNGMTGQTLRDWVHRYNAEGISGLKDRFRSGRTTKIPASVQKLMCNKLNSKPDPDKDGVVSWRIIDSQAWLAEEHDIHCEETAPRRIELGFRKMTARPQHHKQDEARIGQQGKLSRIWALKGTRPRLVKDQRFKYAYIFGAVCPERDTGTALIMPRANSEAMNEHLKEISLHVKKDHHAIVIIDGAGWHKSKELLIPPNLTVVKLPPYAPELNPVENLWQFVKDNYLNNRIFKDYNDIVDKADKAWNKLISKTGRIATITKKEWAKTGQ